MFTDKQEKQLEFLDRMETKESLGDSRMISAVCYSCDFRELYHSAGTVSSLFMPKHEGHNTWIRVN